MSVSFWVYHLIKNLWSRTTCLWGMWVGHIDNVVRHQCNAVHKVGVCNRSLVPTVKALKQSCLHPEVPLVHNTRPSQS